MNMSLVDEAISVLQKVEGVDRQQEEVYWQMASQMERLIESLEDEQKRFHKLAELASEAKKPNLAEWFYQLAYRMNQELESAEKLRFATRRIANQ